MPTKRAPVLGVSFTTVDATQRFPLGTKKESGGATYMYVEFDGTVAADLPVKVRGAGTFLTTASGNVGEIDGISVVAAVDGEFGWVKTQGYHANANVAAGTAANAHLSILADANGDFVTTAGAILSTSGKCLEAESGGLADIYFSG